jgi:hypothetical protein
VPVKNQPNELLADPGISEIKIAYIARELAMDVYELPQILEFANVTADEFSHIEKMPRFKQMLENEVATWASSLNVTERVKIKAQYMVEDWLKTAQHDVHDTREPLSSRVQVTRLVTQLAGMGTSGATIEGGGGERFSVTINLGGDQKLKFEKELPKVIEGEVIEENP